MDLSLVTRHLSLLVQFELDPGPDRPDERLCSGRQVLLLSKDEAVVPLAEEVVQGENIKDLAIFSGEGIIVQNRDADAQSHIFLDRFIVVEDQDDIEIQVFLQKSILHKGGQGA